MTTIRKMYTADNLVVLQNMDAESVDLIYLDPPFNSNRTYADTIKVGPQRGKSAEFDDTWVFTDADMDWLYSLQRTDPTLYKVIDAAGDAGDDMKSYLCFMSVRLREMRRVLKPTGSLYLHCDPTASHYLKAVLDVVFGRASFRNEIVWKRTAGRSDGNQFGRVHDVVLFYAGREATWNRAYLPHDPAYVERAYRNEDERGRWRSADLTASGQRTGESGQPWRGVDPGAVGRHWSTPSQGGMSAFIRDSGIIPTWPMPGSTVLERLDALDAAGLVAWPKKPGGIPSLKRYLASTKGTAVEDIFADIPRLEAASKEKIGYPTQKPLALLERIIEASSNPGDVVLDPFAGCATSAVAAERLGRQWIGIDKQRFAVKLIVERLQREFAQGTLERTFDPITDIEHEEISAAARPPSYRDWREALYEHQSGVCAGCETRLPYVEQFAVDHIVPRSKGGTDAVENLQLLCGMCNSMKGSGTMAELRDKLEALEARG